MSMMSHSPTESFHTEEDQAGKSSSIRFETEVVNSLKAFRDGRCEDYILDRLCDSQCVRIVALIMAGVMAYVVAKPS